MAESYPHFESGPNEGKGKKSGGKPEFVTPDSIKKVGGDTPLRLGDKILNARPLGSEAFKPAEKPTPKIEESPKRPGTTEHEHAEREDWRPVSAQELHDRATADQQARLEDMHMQEHAVAADKDSDEDDEAKKSKKRAAEASDAEAVNKVGPDSEQSKLVEDILIPQEVETSGKTPVEAASQIGPSAEQTDQPAGTEAAFRGIAQAPELADLAAVKLSDKTEGERPVSDDEAFRNMVQNETGEDPGEAQVREQEPGLPPVEVNADEPEPFDQWLQGHPELTPVANTANTPANSVPGHNGAPNSPGAGGPYGFNPNMPGQPPYSNGGGNQPPGGPTNPNAGAWNNGPNVPPNPNAVNNPWAPAGNILNPAVLAGMTALEARQRLDSLRHTAREAGLAGAVGILGLGLVVEHFRVNKTRRMLRKQGKEQTKALSKTNKALRQEQYAHQATKTKLERLDAAHTATNEQLHRMSAALNASARSHTGAETAMGLGLVGAASAAELAANAGKKGDAQLTNEQLAKQLEHDKELGRAIKRNPELRDTTGLASSTAAEQNEFNQEAQSAAGMNALDERQYERLRAKHSDNAGGLQSGGADGRGAPSLPAPQQSTGGSSALPSAQHSAQRSSRAVDSSLVTNPLAWATVVIVIAIVIVAVIVR